MKQKCAFVILNYKTPKSVIQLLRDIEKQPWSKDVKIYIVDNASNDGSVEIIENTKTVLDVDLITSDRNLGYAKGNNLGIRKAFSEGYDTVLLSNSDISIPYQKTFLQTIFNLYEKDKNIAIIAPQIVNNNGIPQNPFRKMRFSRYEVLKMKLFFLTGFYRLYYILRMNIFYGPITMVAKLKAKRQIENRSESSISNSGFIYAPHGSFMVFTPCYFAAFDGLDEGTFLYCEEFILAENLYRQNLKCWYENTIRVYHGESESLNSISKNHKEKVSFTLIHTFNSCKYFVKYLLRSF